MYKAIDIARYVINYCNKHDYDITNLKLQKMLYFIQGGFYLQKNKPCFEDDFECWQYGPVIPSVYSDFKIFGSNQLPEVHTLRKYNFEKGEYIHYDWDFSFEDDSDARLVDAYIDVLSKRTTYDLVRISHNQSPWRNNYEEGKHKIIPKRELKEYFEHS